MSIPESEAFPESEAAMLLENLMNVWAAKGGPAAAGCCVYKYDGAYTADDATGLSWVVRHVEKAELKITYLHASLYLKGELVVDLSKFMVTVGPKALTSLAGALEPRA